MFLPSGSSASSIPSSGFRHDCDIVKIEFPFGWGQGSLFSWYRSQHSTTFDRLQLRKEHQKPFQHEFILLSLENGEICRLERRPEGGNPRRAVTDTGVNAVDTIQVLHPSDRDRIQKTSSVLIELGMSHGADLVIPLEACYAIQQDCRAKRYTLQRYNCYFFSLTITMIVARQVAAWDVIALDPAFASMMRAIRDTPVPPSIRQYTWHKQIQRDVFHSAMPLVLSAAQPILVQSLNKLLLHDDVRSNIRLVLLDTVQDIVCKLSMTAFGDATHHLFRDVLKNSHCDAACRVARNEVQFTPDMAALQAMAANDARRTAEGAATRITAQDRARATATAAVQAVITNASWDAAATAARETARAAAKDTGPLAGKRSASAVHRSGSSSGDHHGAWLESEWDKAWQNSWDETWQSSWHSEWDTTWRSVWQSEWKSLWNNGPAEGWSHGLVDMIQNRIANIVADEILKVGLESMRIFVRESRSPTGSVTSFLKTGNQLEDVTHHQFQKFAQGRVTILSEMVAKAGLGSVKDVYSDVESAICQSWVVFSDLASGVR